MENRRVVLAERPRGRLGASTTRLESGERPVCGEGEALIRVGMLSIDPTIRTWMDDAPGYLPPIEVGGVVRGAGAGVVVESRTPRYAVGDVVVGMTGWQEWALATDEVRFSVVPAGLGLDLAAVMNVLGVTGVTAWVGVHEVGGLREGDTVVVSAAAGATGSVAGQLAREGGARTVVGIAGGPEKCREVVETYRFDACLDYREANLAARLREACPQGVDLYFDNVGGAVLDAVLANLAMHARVALCGAIAQYDGAERHGLANTAALITRRGTMRGFIVLDYLDRFAQVQGELAAMVRAGRLAHREHLVEGLDRAPDALSMLLRGENHGKTLVVVDPEVTLA